MPKENELSVILDIKENIFVLLETTESSEVIHLKKVSKTMPTKEGERDRGLTYWQEIHENLFSSGWKKVGLHFSQEKSGCFGKEFK